MTNEHIDREPPTVLTGYVEVDGTKEVAFHAVEVFMYSPDILKLRKIGGITKEELQKIRTDRRNTENSDSDSA